MKYLRNLIILIVGLYILTLGLVYVDVYDSRPLISLFKKMNKFFKEKRYRFKQKRACGRF